MGLYSQLINGSKTLKTGVIKLLMNIQGVYKLSEDFVYKIIRGFRL
jgi:hypothetical protein